MGEYGKVTHLCIEVNRKLRKVTAPIPALPDTERNCIIITGPAFRICRNFEEVGRMKMFVLVYSSAIDDDVISAISKGGIKAYTKWTDVHGTGPETDGPRPRHQ
jgi:hypothetical protein